MRLFAPIWRKFDAEPVGSRQFDYLFDKDVTREWSKATYPGLNEGRKMAVRFYWFTAELDNGGLPQYFWNSSGAFISEQVADFLRIGCPEAARVLSTAAQKVFGTDSPPHLPQPRHEHQRPHPHRRHCRHEHGSSSHILGQTD